jgi:nicotinamide riboside transporter PnuC
MTKHLEIWGAIATVAAVIGVLMNNAKLIWCFPLWICSNGITLYLHVRKRIFSLAIRDAIFLVLAVIGWIMWAK